MKTLESILPDDYHALFASKKTPVFARLDGYESCLVCGEAYLKIRHDQRYCSRECAQRRHEEQMRERYQRKKISAEEAAKRILEVLNP